MLKFSVPALEKGPVSESGELPPEFLALSPEDLYTAAAPVKYALTAKLVSGSVLVTGTCETQVRTVCGRCLKELTLPVKLAEFSNFYEAESGEVDAAPEVRDELLLQLPVNPLCREDCAGLCPLCGADRNVKKCSCVPEGNSCWQALEGLKL